MSYFPTYAIKPAINWLELSSDQTYSSNAVVAWDTLTQTRSGRVTLASNQITLQPGEYVINGCVAVQRNVLTTSYGVEFRDSLGTTLTEADGWMDSQTVTEDMTGSQVLQARVILTSALTIDTYITGSAGDIRSDGSHLIILEL